MAKISPKVVSCKTYPNRHLYKREQSVFKENKSPLTIPVHLQSPQQYRQTPSQLHWYPL